MSRRIEKVNELITQEIAKMMIKIINDPQFGFVTVTGAKCSDDLKSAKVYISVLDSDPLKSLKILNKKRGEFQYQLNRKLEMRFVPQISFRIDDTAAKADRLEQLFNKIKKKENPHTKKFGEGVKD